MLLAASESAVTKKPRLRVTMRRSSAVRPFGSFHSWMSRLMLISCGIQWLAQAARYFSQAHLYLNGTSWLTSALELMTDLSSTLTRRTLLSARAGSLFAAPAGTKPALGATAIPGMAGSLAPSSSKLSMARPPYRDGLLRPGHFAASRLAIELARARHLAGGDIQVPLGAGERQPLGVAVMAAQQAGVGQVAGVTDVHRVEGEQAPARHHDRVQAGGARRRPHRRQERPGEAAAAE